MSSCTQHFRSYGTLIARILMGGFFLLAGINKLTSEAGVAGTAGYIESTLSWMPLTMLVAWLVVLLEIVLGAALVVGYKASKAALGLAIFTILATLLFHEWMDMGFMKNVAIIGGLFYMVAYGPGDGWSLANKAPKAVPAAAPEPEAPEQNFTV